MSLRCRFMARGAPLFFGSGTTPKRNYLSFWYRFILERCGTKKWPRSKERQERGRNDPECLGKGDRTVAKEGRTIRELRSFRFSFLSFGHRSSFESRSESFRKKRKFRNDTGTRSERGGRVGKSGSVSPNQVFPHFPPAPLCCHHYLVLSDGPGQILLRGGALDQ